MRATATKLPWQIWAFLLVMMLPHTIAFYAGPVLITSFRLVMIILAVPIIIKLTGKQVKMATPDFLLLAFSAWTVLCIMINYPGGGADVEKAGQFLLEVTLPFLLARAFFSDLAQIEKVIKILFVITAIALVLAIPEAVSHQKPIIELTSKITGIGLGFYYDGTDIRMGLRRAQAFFENPILYGIFCATGASLIWYTEQRMPVRLAKLVVIAAATFFSASSAPLLLMMTQFLMIAIETATRNMRNRVAIITVTASTFFLALQVFTKSGPLGIIINYMTFNQASSYARVLIWNWGMQNIVKHPIFGLIVEDWERAPFMGVSIDNFWIFTGIISGFVGWGLLIFTVIAVFRRFNRIPIKQLAPREVNLRRAWSIMMLAFAFTGFSVMFFGKLQPYFYFMLGLGSAAANIYLSRVKQEVRNRRMAGQAAAPLRYA